MSIKQKPAAWILCLAIISAVLSSCALNGKQQAIDPNETVSRVWPESPAKARIAYVSSFSSPADLGISKGLFAQIVDFITGGTEWHLVRPMAVLVTEDGIIYVADPGSRAVHRFDTLNKEYRLIVVNDNQALPSPTGLALGAKGEVYITDSSLGQIYVVQPGSYTAEPLDLEVAPDQPTNIAVDLKNQRLYVVDAANHHIKVYGTDGSFLATIGERGDKEGEFNFPSMIWIDNNDRLQVSDALNFRVQIFDLYGRFIKKFGQHGDATGDMARPKGVAADSFGHIYVVDALFHSFQLFNDSGEFLLNVGQQGNATGEFLLPTGIYITHDNMIYIADSQNSRIQVFRYIGNQP